MKVRFSIECDFYFDQLRHEIASLHHALDRWAEDEQERGIRRPFMIIKDDEVHEYGMGCFRCENGELLRAQDHNAIESIELSEG
ncbi:hypothetical protein TorRG33x02_254190 [Trema orientale]|uniref:Uncharacterized protein n=1 Tax=Trema orientale TaxID=63057 RepID=A0A2P5DEB2_TREOI|nr:hypothetical protein TorRG33x02_254190 [Trema orientale]